jgi:hypothetical protein
MDSKGITQFCTETVISERLFENFMGGNASGGG